MAVIGKAIGSQIGVSFKGGYPATPLTISGKNATPKTTPHAVGGLPSGPSSPMPNNQLAMNPPMNKPMTITPEQHTASVYAQKVVDNQMGKVGGSPRAAPDTGHFRQQTVSGDLFGIQGFPRGGSLGL